MKIVASSDWHGNLPENLPEASCLLIGGDISPVRESHHPVHQEHWTHKKFLPYLDKLINDNKFSSIVFIGGNHDAYLEKLYKDNTEDSFRKTLPSNVHYLRDNEVVIDGKRIYGTPFCTNLPRWYFNSTEEALDNRFSAIPEGLDVLLTHAPPYGYGDKILIPIYAGQEDLGHLGCKSLYNHVKRAKPRIVFSGHLHSGDHNMTRLIYSFDDINKYTKVYNVSLLDENYDIYYKAKVLDI